MLGRFSEVFRRVRGHTIYAPGLDAKMVVLDAGANRGEFSRELRKGFGGTYLLIEANAGLCEGLREVEGFTVRQAALCSHDGPVGFNLSRNDEGSSLLPLPEDAVIGNVLAEKVEVPGVSLAAVLREQSRDFDVVKMDVEGAELEILRSAPAEALQSVGQLTVEFHCGPAFGLACPVEEVDDVIARLQGLGFLALDFSHSTRGNVLFINLAKHAIPLPRRLAWSWRYMPPRWLRGLAALIRGGKARG